MQSTNILDVEEFIIMNVPGESAAVLESQQPVYTAWNPQNTRALIDLYKKHKSKLGTMEVRNMKKLFEVIARAINSLCKINMTSANCENRWRVLERGYKKYVDNQNKTGRGRKYFEYAEEMDQIFRKKRSIHPAYLLSAETVSAPVAVATPSVSAEDTQELPMENRVEEASFMMNETITPLRHSTSALRHSTPKQKQHSVLNRNRILENMRKDKQEYHTERSKIEKEKLEVQKQKLLEMRRRNDLLEEKIEIRVINNFNKMLQVP